MEVERGTPVIFAVLQSLSFIEPNLTFHSLRNNVYVVVGDVACMLSI